ncbi:LysR family transcriptional regulator [Aliiglaciecola lipolytica]|nr:LysR family transcriptional regulator [Aliiglaciecola sp. 2_MG-2023]MBU2878947.1 LysR family transcriptional regulator [Aliiglaciecola lipolytica]
MELRHLRYFCAVAEELNLTNAAKKLFIAQPPLTRQIKQLEEEIGVTLFNRHPRGLTLTPAGQYFWQHAKQILSKVSVTIEDTRRVAESGKIVFGIGFVPSVFYGQFPTMVRRLRQNNTAEIILYELKTRDQLDALKTGKIDIGLGRIYINDPEIEQTTLLQEPMLVALHKEHPLASKTITMAELAKLPMILYPAGQSPTFADICIDLFSRNGLNVRIAQQVNDIQTALALVASEMGFALVPEQVKRMTRDDVVLVQLEDKSITSPVICSRRKEPYSEIMQAATQILDELVENQKNGRYS